MKTLIFVVYIAIGIVVAAMNDYLGGVGNVSEIINLVLAIVLWPAVLLGVEFNVDIESGNNDGGDKDGGGDGGGDGKKGGGGKKNGAVLLVGSAAAYARTLVESVVTRARARSHS